MKDFSFRPLVVLLRYNIYASGQTEFGKAVTAVPSQISGGFAELPLPKGTADGRTKEAEAKDPLQRGQKCGLLPFLVNKNQTKNG